mmetsp:Transcript_19564/g.74066  ORF Transcript_19564/g.74066 Transcript_19564/m.74066 type:complete len:85 (+) Transcript_19564:105-359(+)
MDLRNEYWNVIVQCALLVLALFIVISVVFAVHRSIEVSLHEIRSREFVNSDNTQVNINANEATVDQLEHGSPPGRVSVASLTSL